MIFTARPSLSGLPRLGIGVGNSSGTDCLPAGFETKTRRSSAASLYVVVEGSGTASLDDKPMALAPRDVLVVPSWTALRFKAEDTLVLFGYSDRACQEKLNLFREENA